MDRFPDPVPERDGIDYALTEQSAEGYYPQKQIDRIENQIPLESPGGNI